MEQRDEIQPGRLGKSKRKIITVDEVGHARCMHAQVELASWAGGFGVRSSIRVLSTGVGALVLLLAVAAPTSALAPGAQTKPTAYKVLCKKAGYECVNKLLPEDGKYTPASAAGFWGWKKFGDRVPGVSTDAPHNCTLFAAFMAYRAGVDDPWGAKVGAGDAGTWQDSPSVSKYVDAVPAIGAIAELTITERAEAGIDSKYGHVAYVYDIQGTKVFTMSDNWGAGATSTEWFDISIVKSMRFIHFADASQAPTAPSSVKARFSGGAVYVTWSAPQLNSHNGRAPTRFTVRTRPTTGTCDVRPSMRDCTIPAVKSKAELVRVIVTAVGKSGEEAPMGTWLTVVIPSCPAKPAIKMHDMLFNCYDTMTKAGLLVKVVDAKRNRMVLNYFNWRVVEISPKPGDTVDMGDMVTLRVKKYSDG
mgnify:CR=1 FL=1